MVDRRRRQPDGLAGIPRESNGGPASLPAGCSERAPLNQGEWRRVFAISPPCRRRRRIAMAVFGRSPRVRWCGQATGWGTGRWRRDLRKTKLVPLLETMKLSGDMGHPAVLSPKHRVYGSGDPHYGLETGAKNLLVAFGEGVEAAVVLVVLLDAAGEDVVIPAENLQAVVSQCAGYGRLRLEVVELGNDVAADEGAELGVVAVGGVEGLAVGECAFDVLQPAFGLGKFFERLAVEGGLHGPTV